MSPRGRRLLSDLRGMEQLACDDSVAFISEGQPPELYRLMLSTPGLAFQDGRLSIRGVHRCEVYLHLDYPRRPPVITWLTPIFHPNILGPERNGGVCIGSWSAAESLADLCVRLRDLAAYHSFNATDALNLQAADWVRRNDVRARSDVSSLIGLAVDQEDFSVTLVDA
jgi:ubiquitin-protein ligase